MSIKEYPTLHVASCLTGIGLCDGLSYARMQEVASHLFGASLWTHELVHGPTRDAYIEEGYRQFPAMPTIAEDAGEAEYEAAAAKALSEYGETVFVTEGLHGRRETPIQTLASVYRADDKQARSAP